MENFLHLIHNDLCCYEYEDSYSNYKDEDNNSLLQIAYTKNETLFNFLLLSSKIDLNNVNNQGKTIYDQALEKEDYLFISNLQNSQNLQYDRNSLTIISRIGSGSYGDVFLAKNEKDQNIYALKKSSDEDFQDNITFDIFKEIMILKNIKTSSICKFHGMFKDDLKNFYIVLDYIKFNLKDVLNIFSKFNVDCKRQSLMKIFKNLIIAVNDLNEYGMCHFDLNPANIMITLNLEIKLIDLGFCTFLGLEKSKINTYLETYCVKAPDDSIETFYYLNGKNIQFLKLQNYRINYSSDMFSIGVIVFNAIIGQKSDNMFQLLALKNGCYYFRRTDSKTVKMTKLSHAMKLTIETFSIYAMDFLIRSMAVDSSIRFTCYEALSDPFLSGEIKIEKETGGYYSITDIHVYDFMQDEIYTSTELMLNQHELKYSEQITRKYSQYIIYMSEYDPQKEMANSTNLKSYPVFDRYCNYLIVDAFFFEKYGTYLNESDSQITLDLIGAVMENHMHVQDDKKFFGLKYLLIQSDILFIPFKSLLIGRTNHLRIEGHSETEISRFYCKSHIWLINFLSNKRKYNISMDELLNIFEDLAFLRRISPNYVWVLEKIQE